MSIHILLECVGDPSSMLIRGGVPRSEIRVDPDAAGLPTSSLHESIRGARAVISPLTIRIDEAFLDAAGPGLGVVANYAVGVDNIDLEACRSRNVVVCNGPPPMIEPTADIAWFLLLGAARRTRAGIALAESGDWTGYAPGLLLGHRLVGGTILIVGAGRIGTAVARRAVGWEMEVLYTARSDKPALHEPPIGAARVALEEGLSRADAVVLTPSLNPSTHHLIDAQALERMKPDAVLVNVSRGPVVDEIALADALRNGRIFGAGLDVFEREPAIAPELRNAPNVLMLPHLGSATIEDRSDLTRLTVDNVLAVLAGRRPPFAVDSTPES